MFSTRQIEVLENGKATGLPASRVITEAELPSSAYTYFLYDEGWLKNQATLPELLEGLRMASLPGLGNELCHYTHAAVARRLAETRSLLQKRVPMIAEFNDYLLLNERRDCGRALNWLSHLTHQIHEAQPEDLDFFFTEIASTLQNEVVIRTETGAFRITELEFYYHNRHHPDPYVHRGPDQLKHLHWYFNQATSLDLTFGDPDTNSYGGILLRGLQQLMPADTATSYISGPQLATRALVASWGSALHGATYLGLEDNPHPFEPSESPWRTARIGLALRPDEEDPTTPYISRPYRYIAGEGYLARLPNKEKICQQLGLPADTIRRILGYKPGWL
jgi:hypothetical protein